MKRSIWIMGIVLAAFCLTAFGYLNWGDDPKIPENQTFQESTGATDQLSFIYEHTDVDLGYRVSSRYDNTITKEAIKQVRSIKEVLPQEVTQSIESFQIVEVGIPVDDYRNGKIGDDAVLNEDQRHLFSTAHYSSNFFISAHFKRRTPIGTLKNDSLMHYLTVIPEQEAEYAPGADALTSYFKRDRRVQAAITDAKKLKPCVLYFTVTKNGSIESVTLDATSGFPALDKVLVDMVSQIPGQWIPAMNADGAKVDQQFILFCGMDGC